MFNREITTFKSLLKLKTQHGFYQRKPLTLLINPKVMDGQTSKKKVKLQEALTESKSMKF